MKEGSEQSENKLVANVRSRSVSSVADALTGHGNPEENAAEDGTDLMRVTALYRLNTLRFAAAMLAVILLAGASVQSGVLALRDTWRSFKAGTPDFAVAYRQKLSGAMGSLPKRGTIGYVSDSNDEGEFYLTQYLVVPLILEKGQRPELVLVNDHVATGMSPSREGYTVSRLADGSMVYDFGNGIKLIDRRHEP